MSVILRGLRSDSHFVTAQRNDPLVAEQVAGLADDSRKWSPPPGEWDLTRELLASVVDRLGELITATVNANAKRPSQPPPPYPRPITEIDRALARIESKIEDELADLIAGAHDTWDTDHPYN